MIHRRGRGEVVPAEADEGDQPPIHPEPHGVVRGVRHGVRERERGDGPEHSDDRADERGPHRHGRPAGAALEREPRADDHGDRQPGAHRSRGDHRPGRRCGAGADRAPRRAGRAEPDQHDGKEDRAGADRKIERTAAGRLVVVRRAEREPGRRKVGTDNPEHGAERPGHQRRGRGRDDGAPRREPQPAQRVHLGRARRGVPRDRLSDEEQCGEQGGEGERDEAARLERDRPLDHRFVVQQVADEDVVPPGDPGEVVAEPAHVGRAVAQPDERVDELRVLRPGGAGDLGPVPAAQRRRELDPTGKIGCVDEPRRDPDADDVQGHPGPGEPPRVRAGE